MSPMRMSVLAPAMALLLLEFVTIGCATSKLAKQAAHAESLGNWDAAVAYYQGLLQGDPGNTMYDIRLRRAKTQAAELHQETGKKLWNIGEHEAAYLEYQLALQLNPGNQVAETEFLRLARELSQARGEEVPLSRIERIKQEIQRTPLPVPTLSPGTDRISAQFRRAPVREVYETLATIGGLNVIFDQTLQNNTADLVVNNVSVTTALDLLAMSQGHFYKPLGDDTFIVVPDNPTKRAQYTDQIIQTFFLSNASAATVANNLRILLEARSVVEDEELNAVTIRDSPRVVELASALIATMDKSKGEVLLDLEILEVNRRVVREYGISLQPFDVVQSIQPQTDSGISLQNLLNLDATNWFLTVPSIRYRLFKETGDFKLIADPQLRLLENTPGRLLIGAEVPIITTTFSSGQLVGNQVVPIRSTAYRDVGITVNATVRVHHNEEVTVELEIEISSVAGVTGVEGQPIFNTRQITVSTRMRDGETQLIAGLLQDEERVSMRGVPGLMDLPLIGKLFRSTSEELEQTDIILSVTPHILRTADISMDDLAPIYVGAQNTVNLGFPGGSPRRDEPAAPIALAADERSEERHTALSLTPAMSSLRVGEPMRIDIRVDRGLDLSEVELAMTFDDRVLRLDRIEQGPLLSADTTPTVMEQFRPTPDRVEIILRRSSSAFGIDGDGVIATLYFVAVGAGDTSIQITSAVLRDPRGSILAATLADSIVHVEGSSDP